ncbi:exopolysaccharide biosynthesis polyprenyl glycosylphosphotransferase [Leptospira kanakyensis]|uniref:exopolysaccharide biosynthesis polyprenyl glycosylphosphotransferase n=1 Tax=Leptospira kanakyensis TaxID=2484968 RepID=UPI00223E1658|nr:exopolysaccharide biosynthesis polyprenyl glycosylphosphotransferase [Leptospira kanakyensis]MCW7471376.1 exopolysaccharide biosynthesis polyprenyl glycosylphosphotransferase [Leptospira kanakyensis]
MISLYTKKYARIPFLILLVDILGIFLSVEFLIWVNSLDQLPLSEFYIRNAIFSIFILFQMVFNTYQPLSTDLRMGFVTRYILSFTLFCISISAVLFLTEFRYLGGLWGRGLIFQNLLILFCFGFLFRLLIKEYKKRVIQAVDLNALIILDFEQLQSFFKENLSYLNNVNTYVYLSKDQHIEYDSNSINMVNYIRGESNLAGYFKQERLIFDFVIFNSNVSIPKNIIQNLMNAKLYGLKIFDLTDFIEYYYEKIAVLHVQDRWLVFSNGFSIISNKIALRLKTMFDFLCALILLVLSFPIILFFGIVVKITSAGPIFYTQIRVGRSGKEFKIYKLRTMSVDAEKEGVKWSIISDPRITKVGNFLRKTRIDELPQLFNILRGDMSFIGPRPERPEFIKILVEQIPYYNLRHLLKPGLSGWAQVNFDYGSSVEDSRIKLEYDLYYIKNYSFFLDLRIVIKTIRVVIFGRGR